MLMNQTRIIDKMLERFKMQDSKGASTPMEATNPEDEINTNLPYRELIKFTSSPNIVASAKKPTFKMKII